MPPAWRARLQRLAGCEFSPTDLDRLTVLAFLHDAGKAGAGFYSKGVSDGEQAAWLRCAHHDRAGTGAGNWAACIQRATGSAWGTQPGPGASGGLGAGFAALLGGRLHPRFDIVMQYLELNRLIADGGKLLRRSAADMLRMVSVGMSLGRATRRPALAR